MNADKEKIIREIEPTIRRIFCKECVNGEGEPPVSCVGGGCDDLRDILNELAALLPETPSMGSSTPLVMRCKDLPKPAQRKGYVETPVTDTDGLELLTDEEIADLLESLYDQAAEVYGEDEFPDDVSDIDIAELVAGAAAAKQKAADIKNAPNICNPVTCWRLESADKVRMMDCKTAVAAAVRDSKKLEWTEELNFVKQMRNSSHRGIIHSLRIRQQLLEARIADTPDDRPEALEK